MGDRRHQFRIVGELSARGIDTGLGVGRLAAVLQDAPNLHETDLYAPVLHAVRELAGREGGASARIVADHACAAAFLLADGVLPASEGRGYVLRRLMRRAIRHARLLGVTGAVLPSVTAAVVDLHGGAWPELERGRALIEQAAMAEEEGFARTLRQGSRVLDAAIRENKLSAKALRLAAIAGRDLLGGA